MEVHSRGQAAGVQGVIVPTSGSAPINGDTIKTSAGTVFQVPIAKVAHPKDALFLFDAYGIQTLGITEKATDYLYAKPLLGPTALVLGDEHKGISKGVIASLKDQAKLPMAEGVDSLNVSVACAVVCTKQYLACNFLHFPIFSYGLYTIAVGSPQSLDDYIGQHHRWGKMVSCGKVRPLASCLL